MAITDLRDLFGDASSDSAAWVDDGLDATLDDRTYGCAEPLLEMPLNGLDVHRDAQAVALGVLRTNHFSCIILS